MGMLHCEFHGLDDPEALYQEAWTELLELRADGQSIAHPRALLKKIAWRRARDEHRDRHTAAIDPASQLLVGRPDVAPPVDEQTQSRLDSVPLRHIIEDLDPRQAAVIKLRFDEHRTASEIREHLGITHKRMEKIVAAAYERVAAELDAPPGGESRWRRRQRSLLLTCEAGLASAAQRTRAQQMVDEDPICRAMLHEMRTTLRELGALVPLPLMTEADDHRLPRAFGALWDRIAIVREELHDLIARSPGHAQSLEQAGAGLTGGVGAGTAAKVVAACLAAVGTTAVCVQTLLPAETAPPRPPPVRAMPHVRATTAVKTEVPVINRVVEQPATRSQQTVSVPSKKATSATERPVSSPAASAAPSPAPAGATEFGPGAVGSAPASPAPAAAPTNGGGEFSP